MQLLVFMCFVAGAFAFLDEECPANSHFEQCGTACPLTCGNYENPPKFCILMCGTGCHCDEGYVQAEDGRCVLPENCPVAASIEKSCLGKPDGGMCRGFFPAWHYNIQTGICKKFVYGGCGGNGNRYATEEECLEHCGNVKVKQSSAELCELEAETGVCRGYFPRFAFDSVSGKCKQFIYGGCGGNSNNFLTQEECESSCQASPAASAVCEQEKVIGPCRALFFRYYFNKATGQCESFGYGGCQGNGNNFLTKEQCELTCFA